MPLPATATPLTPATSNGHSWNGSCRRPPARPPRAGPGEVATAPHRRRHPPHHRQRGEMEGAARRLRHPMTHRVRLLRPLGEGRRPAARSRPAPPPAAAAQAPVSLAGPGDRRLPIRQRRGDRVESHARLRREQTHKRQEAASPRRSGRPARRPACHARRRPGPGRGPRPAEPPSCRAPRNRPGLGGQRLRRRRVQHLGPGHPRHHHQGRVPAQGRQGLRPATQEVGGGVVELVDDAGPAQREGL